MRRNFMLILCILAVSCAPKPESISWETNELQAGPRLDDVDLQLDSNPPAVAKMEWSADIPGAVVFRLVDNLFAVRNGLNGANRKNWAKNFINALPQSRQKLSESSYAEMLIEKTKDLAAEKIAMIEPELKSTSTKVADLLKGMKPVIGSAEKVSLSDVVHRTFGFLREFDEKLSSIGLFPEVIEGMHRELEKVVRLEKLAIARVAKLNEAKTIQAAIDEVYSAAKALGFDLKKKDLERLAYGRKLGARIESIADPRSALSTLVEIWIYLSPAERKKNFDSASPELYKYLSEQSSEDLQCLKDLDCISLPKWIARTFVIEPKIEAYGVDKIRALLNQKGADEVRDQLLVSVREIAGDIPKEIVARVEKAVQAGMAPIMRLKKDFSGEMRDRLEKWAGETVEDESPSVLRLQPSRAKIRISSSGRVEIDWREVSDDTLENAGTFNAVAPMLWREAEFEARPARALLFSEMTMLITDYKRSHERHPSDPLHIVSARAYAEAVRGLSSLAIAFRDWENNAVDLLTGMFKGHDLFPEFDISDLDQALFPKDAFFALSFHSLNDSLQTLRTNGTQVFIIDSKNRVTLTSQAPSDEEAAAVMAGIADRDGDQLAATVRAEDVARYLIAMCNVYEATRSVELSQSPYLLKPDKEKKIPRDKIVASREEIRQLILGLSNYLSHQFRAGGELIRRELVIATQKPYDLTVTVLDQVLAIRALVAASETLGNDIYRWEAIDLVTSLNRNMYRANLGFYARRDEKSISPVVLLETLRALDSVSPYLKPFSRRQIEKLTGPWRAKLADWKLAH